MSCTSAWRNRSGDCVARAAWCLAGRRGIDDNGGVTHPQGKPNLVTVTLGMMDGTTLTGVTPGFSPHQRDIHVKEGTAAETGAVRFVAGEQVAFVAIHRHGPPASSRGQAIKRKRVKVHVCGGTSHLVDVDATALNNPLGFFGTPSDPESPYEQMFFYAHGINAKEDAVPLGEMLVRSGAVDPQKLKQGLDLQGAERSVPIGQILVDKHEVDPEAVEQAAKLQERKRLRIGELLISAGWINEEQLQAALAEQKKRKGKRIGELLVELGVISEEVLCSALAGKFLLPLVDLDTFPVEPDALYAVPKEIIVKHNVLPIRTTNKTVTLAIGDPLAVDAIEAVRFATRKRVEEVMVVTSQLKRHVVEAIARLESETVDQGIEELVGALSQQEEEDARRLAQAGTAEVSEADSTVIRLVDRIIVDAYRKGASDIHIEPNGADGNLRVRIRVDGECEEYRELPPTLRRPVVARIKIMASLDISERRKPQDGKIRFHTKGGYIELRVATLPTVNDNEDVVMRILASSKPLPPEAMRYSPRNLTELTKLIAKPYGLFLVVGPTGSGKTTTLHSILGSLNTVKKIWTAEDPVEITQPGLRQVQMQPKVGLTFAAALRSFLRADPDIIMVGEMRDQETASIAVEASLTGHLVLSTLHTNSAPETITRLIDMGLDPFSFADALLGVLAQRLARCLCPTCKEFTEGTRRQYDELREAYGAADWDAQVNVPFGPAFKLAVAKGCESCKHTGYKGRVGLHELLVVDDELREAIGHRAPIEHLRGIARRSGMTTLLEDGVRKVMEGVTDLQQVLSVCSR